MRLDEKRKKKSTATLYQKSCHWNVLHFIACTVSKLTETQCENTAAVSTVFTDAFCLGYFSFRSCINPARTESITYNLKHKNRRPGTLFRQMFEGTRPSPPYMGLPKLLHEGLYIDLWSCLHCFQHTKKENLRTRRRSRSWQHTIVWDVFVFCSITITSSMEQIGMTVKLCTKQAPWRHRLSRLERKNTAQFQNLLKSLQNVEVAIMWE